MLDTPQILFDWETEWKLWKLKAWVRILTLPWCSFKLWFLIRPVLETKKCLQFLYVGEEVVKKCDLDLFPFLVMIAWSLEIRKPSLTERQQLVFRPNLWRPEKCSLLFRSQILTSWKYRWLKFGNGGWVVGRPAARLRGHGFNSCHIYFLQFFFVSTLWNSNIALPLGVINALKKA